MPNVPGVKVSSTAGQRLPTPDVAMPRQPGALTQLGENLQGASQVAAEVYDTARKKAANDWLTEQHSKLINWENSNVTDPSNEKSAIRQKGEAALGLTPRFKKAYDEYTKGIAESAPNDIARKQFEALNVRQWNQTANILQSHERNQYDVRSKEILDADMNGLVNQARQVYSAGGSVVNVFNDANAMLAKQAETNGWKPEVLATHQRQLRSRMHAQIIQDLENKNPEAALKYFDSVKKDLDFTIPGIKELESHLRTVGFKVEGIKLASTLMSKFGDNATAEITRLEGDAKSEYSATTLEVARHRVEGEIDRKHKMLDRAGHTYYGLASNRMVPDPHNWNPDTDPDMQRLKAVGDPRYSLLYNQWKNQLRVKSEDRRVQGDIDKYYINAHKSQLSQLNEDAYDIPKVSDPKYLELLANDRVNGAPSPKALAEMERLSAERSAKRTQKEDVRETQFRTALTGKARALAEAGVISKSDINDYISAGWVWYEGQRLGKQNEFPNDETVKKYLDMSTLKVYGDPKAFMLKQHRKYYRIFNPVTTENPDAGRWTIAPPEKQESNEDKALAAKLILEGRTVAEPVQAEARKRGVEKAAPKMTVIAPNGQTAPWPDTPANRAKAKERGFKIQGE